MVQTGLFVATAMVDENGTPSDISVEHSLHPVFDRAAVDAIRRWRFLPGRYWRRSLTFSVTFTAWYSSAEKRLPSQLIESLDPPPSPPVLR